MPKARPRQISGFTLPECLMASAILVMVVTTITYSVTTGQMMTYDALHSERAAMVCDAMLEEILARPYTDPDGHTTPGPDSGEVARSTFDAVDDFHGLNEALGNIADATGTTYPYPYTSFARSVTAVYGNVTVPSYSASIPGITITITVTDQTGRQWVINHVYSGPQ